MKREKQTRYNCLGLCLRNRGKSILCLEKSQSSQKAKGKTNFHISRRKHAISLRFLIKLNHKNDILGIPFQLEQLSSVLQLLRSVID